MSQTLQTSTQRGEQAREQLIRAAIGLFGRYGLRATTRDIAREAGQNIAAITYYFGSKEALYLAAAEWIADFIAAHSTPLLAKADRLLEARAPRPALRDCLLEICHRLVGLLTDDSTLPLSQFVFSEQLSPGAAYPVLHEKGLAPLHRRLTALFAGYCRRDENDAATQLHVHALTGTILAFRIGRETLLQRTGWRAITPANTRDIQQVITTHVDLILNGLAAQRG